MLTRNGGKVTPEVPTKGSSPTSHLPKSSPTFFPIPYRLSHPAVPPRAAARLLQEGTEVRRSDPTAAPVLHPGGEQGWLSAEPEPTGTALRRSLPACGRVSLLPIKGWFLTPRGRREHQGGKYKPLCCSLGPGKSVGKKQRQPLAVPPAWHGSTAGLLPIPVVVPTVTPSPECGI